MGKVAAQLGVPIILQHNRNNQDYQSFFRDCLNDIFESIAIVKKAGVTDEQIILDPGIGFAKDVELDLEMMRNLDNIHGIRLPGFIRTIT